MECPKCGGVAEVVTSRPAVFSEGGRVRWRRCRGCSKRWYSWQPPLPPEREIPVHAVTWRGNDILIDQAQLRSWLAAKVSGTGAAKG
jgi:hypothetical protein